MFYDVEKDPRHLSVTEIERRERLPLLMMFAGAGILLFTVLANIVAVVAYLSW